MLTGEGARAFACACMRERAAKASEANILFPDRRQHVGTDDAMTVDSS